MSGQKNEQMRRKRVVISGGGSFIARHFVKKLDINKYDIVLVMRNIPEEKLQIEGIRYIALDMEEYREFDRYIDRCDYYLPFTWAGTRREDRNNQEINEKSYCCILASIKTLIEKCGCTKVIIPGTFSEYKNEYVPINETTVSKPELAYGKYKYQLYQDVSALCKENGISYIEARLFSVYGPDDGESKMINSILKKMIKNEKIAVTKSEHIWDFIHVDDVAEAFLKLMESEVESGCYNVATMDHRTLKSYFEEMKKLAGSSSRLLYGAIPYEDDQIPHVICDTRKILRSVNWKPRISFEKGIQEMIRSHK